jgi:hypothetical protein
VPESPSFTLRSPTEIRGPSSSTIVVLAVPAAGSTTGPGAERLDGLDRVTVKSSSASSTPSATTGTGIVAVVSPAGMLPSPVVAT